MAMLGLRDISSLSIPPADRRSVVTEVAPWDEDRIRRAVVREMNREGQVFVVHNRIHDIHAVADEIRRLVAEARVLVGHGRMKGSELEDVMLRFVRGQADVLVCTTIIESGVDIPNANTMLITNADQYGLADLHQLRGRVGRWKHRAYCYLLLPQERPITDAAAKRLRAVEQYAMLGAGFKIAMRDLEIRGAGNLLGAEQSGHIAAVGYELYCRMLEQATNRLREDPAPQLTRPHLALPASARLPASWIPSEKHRLTAYKRLARAADLETVEAIMQDLREAYGEAPPTAQTMETVARLRVAAARLGIETLKIEDADVVMRAQDPKPLAEQLADAPGRCTVVGARELYYRPPRKGQLSGSQLLETLHALLVPPIEADGRDAEGASQDAPSHAEA
jgi:transcription-repair coupling factor (superfamily II helicase)